MKRLNYLLLILFCSFSVKAAAAEVWSVSSPDNAITAQVSLDAGKLTYTVSKNGTILVAKSSLGLIAEEVDFSSDFVSVANNINAIDETYQLPTGKFHTYNNKCNELDVQFKKESKDFHVIFRAYNDGVAFRYYIPGSGSLKVTAETSEVIIPTFNTCWGQRFSHDYSTLYPARNWQQTANVQGDNGDRKHEMVAPVLVKSTTGDANWCLVTESANYGTYCASKLMTGSESEVGRFYFKLHGDVNAVLPLETSWKTMIIGNLPTIVQSAMTENLNPATEIQDLSWVKSGLSSWDWGGQDGNVTQDVEVIKGYIDLAYKMKWQYYTLDDGWATATYRLKDVIEYADSKGVKVFIWSHQNRFKNEEGNIRAILQNWKNLGFVGVKIDFFDNDSQDEMSKYDKLLKISGEIGLMVNLHGCTKPSGTRRYWPHLITSEAVYGGEQYFVKNDATPASHNVTLALTRNVIGPMDYTPTEFCRLDGIIRHYTTWSHQLALATLYESGIQTMSDSQYNYIYNISKTLLSQLPASWDNTLCLEAEPDKYVTLARQNGDDWYVASISQNARTLSIPLSFLGAGTYTAQIYKDGTCASDIAYEEQSVTNSSTLSVDIKATGGATIRISKTPIEQPIHRVYEAEDGIRNGGVTVENDNKGNCSGGKFIGFLGGGKTLTLNNVQADEAGVYNLTFYYITQDTRNTYVKVNDGPKNLFAFNGNGFSWNSDGMAVKTVQITLNKGTNSIELGNDNGDGINIDRLEVSPSDNYKDISIKLKGLSDGSNYSNAESIIVDLTNKSAEALTDVSVSYQINENAVVTEHIPSIGAGATIEYEFAQKADLSKIAVYNVKTMVNPDAQKSIVGNADFRSFTHFPGSANLPISLKSNGGSIHSYSAQVNSGEGAENLILGDPSKKWCDNQTDYPWVIIKLSDVYNVDRFVIRDCKTRENDRNIDQYIISTSLSSPEENDWTEVVNTINRKQENIKVDNIVGQNALYIKLQTKRPEGDHAIRIYGLDAFGSLATSISESEVNDAAMHSSLVKQGGTLELNNSSNGKFEVYSLNGVSMLSKHIEANAEFILNLPTGVYLTKTTVNSRSFINKLIITE